MLKLPECTTVLESHLTEEIKVVKHARDFALARAKADEEYAKNLFKINTKFGKIQVSEEYEESPIWKVWAQTWKTSDDYAAQLADKSGDVSNKIYLFLKWGFLLLSFLRKKEVHVHLRLCYYQPDSCERRAKQF